MKLILNTVLDPHFCAIFSDKNQLIGKISWTDRSRDGENIYNFLARQNLAIQCCPAKNERLTKLMPGNTQYLGKISFCGGISGPGGFTSLRATASILTSISITNKIPIHQISAEKFIFNVLGYENFLLNSFGKAVWSIKNGKISRDFISNIDLNQKWLVAFLPEHKKKLFPQQLMFTIKNLELNLLNSLKNEKPMESFIPHYEFPPV